MSAYYIQGFEIHELWGYRELNLTFRSDVNILIGPNASGKTTILNLLRYILSADLPNLQEIEFSEVVIRLKSFDGNSTRTIRVAPTEDGFTFVVSNKTFNINLNEAAMRAVRRPGGGISRLIRRTPILANELDQQLKELVKAVWLPVSRRLPISEDIEDLEFVTRFDLESVDVRLRELLQELTKYRLTLDAQLSERYKEFEKRVLQMILYNKQYDRLTAISDLKLPTQDEREQLISAFRVAGLLDSQMQKRIDEHFEAAQEAINRMATKRGKRGELSVQIDVDDLLIIPLISRTKSIIQFARDLEHERENLFTPLHKYEEIVNSFLNGKVVKVEDNGKLKIESLRQKHELISHLLSSGEKQILILLTQALLWEGQPIVYVADEPELSLHVSWQEKLLKSLQDLGKQIQIIVATHSPDIVGPFVENVIDLSSNN